MYNKKLVASIKSGGKIMRENGDTVFLPFGGEYSILLKNLNTVRALVKIEIDGEDVVDGGLVINPNQTVDLERFIVNGNLSEGPRFKFIEKTGEISDYRGDRVEDGIIRVEYQFEAPLTSFTFDWNYDPWDSGYNPRKYKPTVYGGTSGTSTSAKFTRSVGGQSYLSNVNVGANANNHVEQDVFTTTGMDGLAQAQNDNGITVHGNKSTQKFQTTSIGMLELEKHVICLNLKGQVGEHKVTAPVTVSRKIKCGTCGRRNPSGNNCCSKCGTNLTYQY